VPRLFPRCSAITLLVAVVGAICSGIALRWLLAVLAFTLPSETFAQELAMQAAYLPAHSFWSAAGLAGLGGLASFSHEVRSDRSNLAFFNAFGHMVSAQFAGLLIYLLTVEWNWSWPITLAASGAAGWGGNKTISIIFKRLFGGLDEGKRE